MSFLFLIGAVVVMVGGVVAFGPIKLSESHDKAIGGAIAFVGLLATIWSTSLYVNDNQGGLVIKRWGSPLAAGKILAVNGEAGPQAKMLSPGWHFGYIPFLYELEPVDNLDIPGGSVGVVTARDGKSLPDGEVYAPEWKSVTDMLDAEKFLTGDGYSGPQLTVVPPGNKRFNTRLFDIKIHPMTSVSVGQVVVIKADAGPIYEGDDIEIINDVPLVPKGYRGIWKEALFPNSYYMHPYAYQRIPMQTTQRIYSYDGKASINVRTMDGYHIPIDVRVMITVPAGTAPAMVATLANPDGVGAEYQGIKLTVLESRIILPVVRAIFRNSAENQNALSFLKSRSQMEVAATKHLHDSLKTYNIEKDCQVVIGDIRIDEHPDGKKLIATQTDKELAVQQKTTFTKQKEAETERALFILAKENADQQKRLAQIEMDDQVADKKKAIREKEGEAEANYIIKVAEGEQKAYKMIAETIGKEGVLLRETLKLVSEGNIRITPNVVVNGGGGNTNGGNGAIDALMGTILWKAMPKAEAVKASVVKPVKLDKVGMVK